MGLATIMASSFKDTLAKLGYEILKRDGDDILILFEGKERRLLARSKRTNSFTV